MFRISICFIVVAMAWVPGASAQQLIGQANRLSNTYNRPSVSPYLSLLDNRGGTLARSTGANPGAYQRLVRPQLEQREQGLAQQRQIQQIQDQLNRVQQAYRRPTGGLMSTGHPTRFMSYSHYYPSLGRRR